MDRARNEESSDGCRVHSRRGRARVCIVSGSNEQSVRSHIKEDQDMCQIEEVVEC